MTTTASRATEHESFVNSAVGPLGAIVRVPDLPAPLPGVVLVDGSGDGDRDDWGGWPEWIADAGSIVLRHDKPGCGGSPGRWTDQTIEDRADEALAAARVLRSHPDTAGQPIGLYGISQGGWVALLAATVDPDLIDFVVCHSGPGTTPAEQERDRIEGWLRADGLDRTTIDEAMGWVDRRSRLLRGADPVELILEEQSTYRDRSWYATTLAPYDTPDNLRFVRGIWDFDPTAVMPDVKCPVLAIFGGADTVVPAQRSLRAFAEHLPVNPQGHGFAVFPGADHGLFVDDPSPEIARRDQLAPAYLPTLRAFLSQQRVPDPSG